MKKTLYNIMMALGCMASVMSCENGDVEFPDFDYQTVYFANQTPVRTITLGDDVYPTDLDNKHMCQIYATMGGVNANKTDRKLQIAVDETLCSGKQFADGREPRRRGVTRTATSSCSTTR